MSLFPKLLPGLARGSLMFGSLFSFCPAANVVPPARPWTDDASRAIPKAKSERFFQLHEAFLARAKEGPVDLLFLGDSITEKWKNAPHIWEHYHGKYHPVNFGIGGDQTQHLIWRIENGELDGIRPKVVVLMIGTNNTSTYSAEQIYRADEKIVRLIREKLPSTKILLLGIFPRGPRHGSGGPADDAVKRMESIRVVNAGLARLDDGETIRYLDIGPHFLDTDGTIPSIIMRDQLHLTPAGYQLWAEAMAPLLDEMMRGAKAGQTTATVARHAGDGN